MVLITLHDREADLSIVRNGHLLYTRTARLVETNNLGDIAAQLAVEVRRSLAAASLTADPEEQHLYVFGALGRQRTVGGGSGRRSGVARVAARSAAQRACRRHTAGQRGAPGAVDRDDPRAFRPCTPARLPASETAARTAQLLSSGGDLRGGRAGARGYRRLSTRGMPVRRLSRRSRVSGNRSRVPRPNWTRSNRNRPSWTPSGSGKPTTSIGSTNCMI